MSGLEEGRLRPLMHELDRRERELRREVAEARARIEAERAADFDDVAGDEADHADMRIRTSLQERMIDHHLDELRALVAARDRVENGTFGVCADCGEDIDYARLAAVPTAVRCAACQSRHELLFPQRH